VLPVTHGAKIFTILIALAGIPLTFIMVMTGASFIYKLAQDLVRKIFGENRFRSLYLFVIHIFITVYVFSTALIIAKLEGFDYFSALWYTIMALTTVGFGDVVQNSIVKSGKEVNVTGLAVFQMFWLVFGMILFGALVMSVWKGHNNDKEIHHFKIFKNKDEELVENIEDDY